MGSNKKEAMGRESNETYCDRLVQLAFPEMVRVEGRAYNELELRTELERSAKFREDLWEHFGTETRDLPTTEILGMLFPERRGLAGRAASTTVQVKDKSYSKEELKTELDYSANLKRRLVRRYLLGNNDIPIDELMEVVFPKTLRFLDATYSRDDLKSDLPHNPKLQKLVAIHTHYVPSKWLLEQEMEARGSWHRTADAEDIFKTVGKEGLTGVCFSGGGIRSATFNLGMLQGLAQLGLLPHIDYLSSVSGGGYIHEFLAAWILRNPRGRDGVVEELIPQAEPGCLPRAPEPIKWLKRYASYLTPARGMFSADTWTLISIWFRNTILNQIPIVAALSFIFLLIRLLALAPERGQVNCSPLTGPLPWIAEAFFCLIAALSLLQLGTNLRRQLAMRLAGAEGSVLSKTDLLNNRKVQLRLILPWLLFALWTSFWTRMGVGEHLEWSWVGPVAFGVWVLAVVMVVIFAGGATRSYKASHAGAGWGKRFTAGLGFAASGLLATAAACAIGYGLVLASVPVAQKLSDLVGPLDAQKPAKQTLNFSVSGEGEHFTAKLAGEVNGAPNGGKGLRIDPRRIEVVVLPGLLLSIPYIGIELALGLLGRAFSDIRREWLARLRAWSLLYAGLWTGVVGLALLAPYAGYWMFYRSTTLKFSSVAAFAAAHLTTILTGWSGKADGKPTETGFLRMKPMDLLALAAAPVTIIGLLLGISSAAAWDVDRLYSSLPWLAQQAHLPVLGDISYGFVDVICVSVALLVAVLFGWRVDVNEFSMQLFYRNRLSRCYLGATVSNRQADPFTGFDGRGELPGMVNPRATKLPPSVASLLPNAFNPTRLPDDKDSYDGPFPIFCTTLNLTTGEDLATQERKGTSFAFTPMYSGYSVSWTDAEVKKHVSYNGYVPTSEYAYPGGGIHLDTAVAISGAAMNPSQGYNSNPALAFLMTFFNVRLGWWITNTRRMDRWKATNGRVTPRFALWYLLKELVGLVDDSAPFVNLSDGGHFENMGLYELVRRRCRYIVVCDAEQDPAISFDGIGGAITKCRSDFGAEIDLDLRPLRIDEKTGYSETHCVVGTIRYPPPPEDMGEDEDAETSCECLESDDEDRYTGVIVYMKSSLVGDEPADLLAYQLAHGVFPQDSTANQWFTETQFEAYRRLGHHVAMTAIRPALSPRKNRFERPDTLEQLFKRMYAIWYPRTPEMEKHLGDHLKQYESILSELRTRAELAGLEMLLNDPAPGDRERQWVTAHLDKGAVAYATQFANSMLDFMATVYVNLALAFPDNRVSPHAEWWICLFRRWCRVDLVRRSWTEHAPSYPLEFRLFARRELGLPRVAGIRE